MARALKVGLSYFPCDVDILEDPKVQFITARFGAKGDGIFFRILCKVYREGYALPFDEDTALLVARSVGDISLHRLVIDVVEESLKRGFYDRSIFEQFGLLTSHGIQKRYIRICMDSNRKNFEIPAYLKLSSDIEKISPDIKAKSPDIKAKSPEEIPQRKEKEIKEKKDIYERFVRFWSEYPKKTAKESATKAWYKLNPSEELLETMLIAIDIQKKSNSWIKEDGQYIPNPASWLNGKRWEDEYGVSKAVEERKEKNYLT